MILIEDLEKKINSGLATKIKESKILYGQLYLSINFEDLIEVVDILVNVYKKEVYVCGLDGDFKRQKFGKILDLIPNCDEVVELKAL